MKIALHQTHQIIQDFEKIESTLKDRLLSTKSELNIFPELFLTGYPLQDLCLSRDFYEKYTELIERINTWSKSSKKNDFSTAIIGGLDYTLDDQGLPVNIYNIAFKLTPGEQLKRVYAKRLLPNYDIFDEKKYYTPGEGNFIFEYGGLNIGLLICEDMWSSSQHSVDPVQELFLQTQKNKTQLDLIVNLSASPWHLGKIEKRHDRAMEIAKLFGSSFAYVNQISAEDEILFDGSSFICDQDGLLEQAQFFNTQTLTYNIEKSTAKQSKKFTFKSENTWASLYEARIDTTATPPTLRPLSDKDCQQIIQALGIGLQDYVRKCAGRKFDIALSGGIDSALVLALVKIFLQEDQDLQAIYMPGFFSASMSYELSKEMCQRIGIKMYNLPIKFIHSSIRNAFSECFHELMEGLSDENIQSRVRGALLYARSNQRGSLVINTSNKSELSVGYSTLYGDSVGALSLLGDLYKTEVFELCHYINKNFGNIIPEGIITRPPSAELRENQEDSQTLPPYERLDPILEGLLSYRYSAKELIKSGFSCQEVEKAYGLYQKSEYKRRQFCPILKVKAKSFGFGHRVPIAKKVNL